MATLLYFLPFISLSRWQTSQCHHYSSMLFILTILGSLSGCRRCGSICGTQSIRKSQYRLSDFSISHSFDIFHSRNHTYRQMVAKIAASHSPQRIAQKFISQTVARHRIIPLQIPLQKIQISHTRFMDLINNNIVLILTKPFFSHCQIITRKAASPQNSAHPSYHAVKCYFLIVIITVERKANKFVTTSVTKMGITITTFHVITSFDFFIRCLTCGTSHDS